jgi:hypothetical protein
MKTLHFAIDINAPKKKVWDTMLEDKTYREWTSAFAPGSYYRGSWDAGADIRFLGLNEDGTESGMISRIEENTPYESVTIHHIGQVMNGKDDTTSDDVKAWGTALEKYRFTENNGVTTVSVDVDTADNFLEMMNDMWPKGLEKLKEIAERS